MLVVAAGMAVDFMRHEMHRAELQDALDRGVLAAASLTQVRPAEDTIRGYMRTTAFIGPDYRLAVDDNRTIHNRTISAQAEFDIRTYFLKIIGMPTLTVAARGAAIEGKQDIEISLALDVSTSMSSCTATIPANELGTNPTAGVPSTCDHWSGTPTASRLEVMKTSAQEFIDLVINDETKETVTLSLVPFAGQVNPGPVAFNKLRNADIHPYSYCVEFDGSDFGNAWMPLDRSLDQMQYFSLSSYYNRADLDPTVERGWCPGGNDEEIEYHSNDAETLKARIGGLKTHEATGTQYGMKWASMLLDPSSRSLTSDLVTAGDVKTKFAARPAEYTDSDTLKFVVLMTDGRTTDQWRVKPGAYDSAADRDWWAVNIPDWNSTQFNFANDINQSAVSRSDARSQFLANCTAAKEAGVVVFTIGYDIDKTDVAGGGQDAHSDLVACASSPSHFYDAKGIELTSAFEAIAATIQKLKLIY